MEGNMDQSTKNKISRSMREGIASGRIKSRAIKKSKHTNNIHHEDFAEDRHNGLSLEDIAKKHDCSLSYIKRFNLKYHKHVESLYLESGKNPEEYIKIRAKRKPNKK